MYLLENKKTGEYQLFKYATPILSSILGYNEQYFRRKVSNKDKIDTEIYKLHYNCTYDGGNRGGKREKTTGY